MYNQSVILFDGVCNLCNRSVQTVIKHDAAGRFLFASLQSEEGQKLLQQYQLPLNHLSSFVLLQNGKAYTKSYIIYKDLMAGGEMIIEMGAQPSATWGVSRESWPYSSMTDDK